MSARSIRGCEGGATTLPKPVPIVLYTLKIVPPGPDERVMKFLLCPGREFPQSMNLWASCITPMRTSSPYPWSGAETEGLIRRKGCASEPIFLGAFGIDPLHHRIAVAGLGDRSPGIVNDDFSAPKPFEGPAVAFRTGLDALVAQQHGMPVPREGRGEDASGSAVAPRRREQRGGVSVHGQSETHPCAGDSGEPVQGCAAAGRV